MAHSSSFSSATLLEQSIFLLFMIFWIIYGILNQYTSIHKITFDPVAVVWSQEVLKIILSLILFVMQDGNLLYLCKQLKEHYNMIFWYLIPAGLYALTDVLTYINLRVFDPATLHLLGEMKLVVVAIVHQQLFRKMLNKYHWMALVLITTGCILKALDSMELSSSSNTTTIITADDGKQEQIVHYGGHQQGNVTDYGDENNGNNNIVTSTDIHQSTPTLFHYGLIGINILISTIAGVFNEKLLKDKPSICINLQNMCLYFNGILFLSLGMLLGLSDDHKSIATSLSPSNLKVLFSQPSILIMAIIMSLAGIVTSRFLKIFDSIRKSVAVSLVVVTLPLLSKLFFGTPITIKMIISLVLVVVGMHVYTSQPPPARVAFVDNNDTETMDGQKIDKYSDEEDDEAELFLNAISLPGVHHNSDDHERRNGKYTGVVQEMSRIIRPDTETITTNSVV